MAKGAGLGSKMAVSRATTFGVATSVNKANAAIEYLSEDFGFAVPEKIDDESVSRSWPGDPISGNIIVEGSMRTLLRYQTQEYLLAAPLGVAAVSVIVAGANRHKYTYTAETYGNFCTVAIDKGVSVHEYPGFKFSGFTLTGQAGRPTEAQFRGLGNNNVVPATKNTTLAAATFRTTGLHVLWSQMSMLVAAKAGAAPTIATDQYMPASFELTYDRPLARHYVLNNSAEIIEPILDGIPTCNFRVTFPRYATAPAGTPGNVFAVWGKNNTNLKLWLRAVGPTITGTTRNRFDVYLPNCFVQSVTANVGGPAAIPVEVQFTGKAAPAVPTGFPPWIGSGGIAIGVTSATATAPF